MCSASDENECKGIGSALVDSSSHSFIHSFIHASLFSCCLQCIDISGLGFLNLSRIDWTNQTN